MSSLPTWAHLSIIAAAVLLCPALAFLMAIAVEILIGVLKDAGVPALLVLVVPRLRVGLASASLAGSLGLLELGPLCSDRVLTSERSS